MFKTTLVQKKREKRVSGENLLIFMSEIDELCCFEYKNAETSKLKILQLWGFETQVAICRRDKKGSNKTWFIRIFCKNWGI